eukprot:Platyproteum_vivax@DN1076_c0_g1_i1.p1
MSKPPVLHYFDFKGRAFCLRLAFNLGGVKFEDHRIAKSDWPEWKAKSPSGQVPYLELSDGKKMTETVAILHYVGILSKLIPEEAFMAGKMHEVVHLLTSEFVSLIVPSIMEEDLTKKLEMRKVLVDKKIPTILNRVEEILSEMMHKDGECCFAIGNKISLADVSVADICSTFEAGYLDGIPTDMANQYKNIQKIYSSMKLNPIYKATVAAEDVAAQKRDAKG